MTFPFSCHRTIREVDETETLINRWRRGDPPISNWERRRLNYLLQQRRENNPLADKPTPPADGAA